MYIDDVILALKSVEQAIELRKTIVGIFNCTGMQLTKFVTNSAEVLHTIPEEDRVPTTEVKFEPTHMKEPLETMRKKNLPL